MQPTRNVARIGLTALIGLILPVSACKRPAVEVGTTAYIVGPTNDIRPAGGAEEDRGDGITAELKNAAVLIATRLQDKRVKFCSGTLVAPEEGGQTLRILTNHHCFAVPGADGKATRTLLVEACSFSTVYFGFLAGMTQTAEAVGCQPGSLRTSFEGDLAVFTLAHNPQAKFQPLALWQGEDGPVGRQAAIVHYPDVEAQAETPPDGGPKLPTAAITVTDCQVSGVFATSEWELDRTLPFSLRHTCDLIHGSSGSGLIDVQTGTLLGVNWGGIKITYDDGVRVDNVATKASFAQAFLDGREDEIVRESRTTGGSGNLGAGGKKDDGSEKKSETFAGGVKKKACGVVGSDRDGPAGSSAASWPILLLAFGPLVLALTPFFELKGIACRVRHSDRGR